MAENTIKVADLARVRDIEFVRRFDDDMRKLTEVLGVFQPIALTPGTILKQYKTTGTLADGTVAEGEEIPLSKYKTEVSDVAELVFKKWRKQTTMEAIAKRGYSDAVAETDNEMIKDIQKSIRNDVFTFIKGGTGKLDNKQKCGTFQETLASSRGALEIAFESTDASPVYFVNPIDLYNYVGGAQVTIQNAFGFSYIENFLGLGRVIVDTKVEQGKVYSTASENLNIYYANAGSIEGFDFNTDSTGYIGIMRDIHGTNLTTDTVATSAITLFPEYKDRIIVATITPSV